MRLPAVNAQTKALLITATGLAVRLASLNKLVNTGIKAPEKLTPLRIRQSVIAGHKTATATEQYRRLGFKELAEAVREMHPRG